MFVQSSSRHNGKLLLSRNIIVDVGPLWAAAVEAVEAVEAGVEAGFEAWVEAWLAAIVAV